MNANLFQNPQLRQQFRIINGELHEHAVIKPADGERFGIPCVKRQRSRNHQQKKQNQTKPFQRTFHFLLSF
jgi:hypothetical protein